MSAPSSGRKGAEYSWPWDAGIAGLRASTTWKRSYKPRSPASRTARLPYRGRNRSWCARPCWFSASGQSPVCLRKRTFHRRRRRKPGCARQTRRGNRPGCPCSHPGKMDCPDQSHPHLRRCRHSGTDCWNCCWENCCFHCWSLRMDHHRPRRCCPLAPFPSPGAHRKKKNPFAGW